MKATKAINRMGPILQFSQNLSTMHFLPKDISFVTGLGEMKIGMVGGSSKVNSVDISTTGWTVGFISGF